MFVQLPETGEIDLVFVIDTTGSMSSYIQSVKSNIIEIVKKIQSIPICTSIRYGLIEYKDHDESGKHQQLT